MNNYDCDYNLYGLGVGDEIISWSMNGGEDFSDNPIIAEWIIATRGGKCRCRGIHCIDSYHITDFESDDEYENFSDICREYDGIDEKSEIGSVIMFIEENMKKRKNEEYVVFGDEKYDMNESRPKKDSMDRIDPFARKVFDMLISKIGAEKVLMSLMRELKIDASDLEECIYGIGFDNGIDYYNTKLPEKKMTESQDFVIMFADDFKESALRDLLKKKYGDNVVKCFEDWLSSSEYGKNGVYLMDDDVKNAMITAMDRIGQIELFADMRGREGMFCNSSNSFMSCQYLEKSLSKIVSTEEGVEFLNSSGIPLLSLD